MLFAWYLVREVLSAPEGTPKMKEIALAIQEGAKAYLSRQFRTVAVFLAVLAVALFFVLPAPANAEHSAFSIKFGRSIAFILGAGFSALTGLRRACGSPCARTSAPRTPRGSAGCARPCGSRSAPAASPGCSRSGSACSAPWRS